MSKDGVRGCKVSYPWSRGDGGPARKNMFIGLNTSQVSKLLVSKLEVGGGDLGDLDNVKNFDF